MYLVSKKNLLFSARKMLTYVFICTHTHHRNVRTLLKWRCVFEGLLWDSKQWEGSGIFISDHLSVSRGSLLSKPSFFMEPNSWEQCATDECVSVVNNVILKPHEAFQNTPITVFGGVGDSSGQEQGSTRFFFNQPPTPIHTHIYVCVWVCVCVSVG